ncbi:MAG: lipoyl synthase [Chitinivibrionia bacterium]|nr:lipoyl synthase [Chitinivibrionia bacterium]
MLRMPKSYMRPILTGQKSDFVAQILIDEKINTICESANCPNKGECFSDGTASFLALGNICTRNCKFCALGCKDKARLVSPSPLPIDENEPQKFATAIKKLGLSSVVITTTTRDDLPDGGANHLAKCVLEIKNQCPNCKIEILIPDFNGDKNSIEIILNSPIDCISHNIEMPKNLYPKLRDKADFSRSIEVLKFLKNNSKIPIKSGFMLGLGESEAEITDLIKTLAEIPIDILSIGQYFKPTKLAFDVQKYYEADDFEIFAEFARSLGIKKVHSGVFVRTSYKNC